ncbi:MAG: FCD domain-containing protein, partial [Pseudomonadota bacterium]
IGELERLMREAPAETDPLEFFKWDMAFHQAIVKAARNQPLAETHKSYNSRLWRARFISSKMRPARDRTLSQHEDILGALVSRDEAACAQHMRRHLEVAVENIATAQAKLQQMES